MTYRELYQYLGTLSAGQLDLDVTIMIHEINEFVPLYDKDPVRISKDVENDVLDEDHPYLVI
jgi:hypothetical protein